MRAWILGCVVLVVAACGGMQSKIVGTWKVKGIDASSSQSALEKAAGQFGSLFVAGSTFEFNDQGRAKVSHPLGSSEGPYRIEGDKVLVMSSDDKGAKPSFTFKLAEDGTLESIKAFESDLKLVLEKQEQ